MRLHLPKTKWMLRREAASWLARLQSGRDPDTERRFRRWHDQTPRHAAAFDRVQRTYEQAGLLRHSSVLAPTDYTFAAGKTHALRPPLAAALAVAALVPIGVLLVRGIAAPLGGTNAVMLMTSVGEIRQIDLADGSKVTLDTATRIDVEIGRSHRRARLRYGRARFQIAPATVPFVVEAASTTVSSRRGVVDVEQVGEQRRVAVLAGAADVRAAEHLADPPVALDPGQTITVNAAGQSRATVLSAAPDWTRGMLQFDGTPLADSVALANRYSERRIIVPGDLTGLRVTGAFRAGDTMGLARALAAAFHLSLQQLPNGNLLLSRSTSRGAQKKTGG